MTEGGNARPRAVPGRSGRRVGRPARIDRAAIARAAAELPLEELTMRAVAERLGVSVAGLYHHVGGREELLRLAAEQSALRMTLPHDEGQHWAVWCYQWADYIRRAFVADPELLKQYIDGAFGAEVMAEHIDAAIGLCVRQGFTERDAFAIYELLSECALGAAISEIRAVRADRAGEPMDLEMRGLLARSEPAALPNLRRMLASGTLIRPSFADRVAGVLAGVAVRHGADWREVVRLVRSAASEPPG
ncbi:Tetracyclin repressor, C-terminal all-alpha domain [Thermomonospora echinospora]|uniref:Tetracyclin repressor, C-terminal all-alpha domain n=1 Tax=Thermomonospora echinospora TaxID=1992 RepID=A0A1H5T1L7_9ACTN|nr:helix-turn-helix domain-containing protein [Thermomonospora echinospora]SEF56675.1 Tetracyclin repressor, C-terminal all-alpha domain [Thermomonospora echinospora]